MTTLQEYLNNQHPNLDDKKKAEYIKLSSIINSKELLKGGELEISDYPKLEIIEVNGNRLKSKLTKLKITNCPKLIRLECFSNQLTELEIDNCVEIEVIDCSNNLLENFKITNCSNIIEFNCGGNQLTDLKSLNDFLDPKKITKLTVSENKFPSQDLSFFSEFINLKELFVDNNNFTGSLKYLVNCEKLEGIFISNTDIVEGLRYLPEGIRDFSCESDLREESKVEIIKKILMNYGEPEKDRGCKNFASLLRKWRSVIFLQEKLQKNKKKLQIEKEASVSYQELSLKYQQQRENKIKELEEKNTLLQQKTTLVAHKDEITNDLNALENQKTGLEKIDTTEINFNSWKGKEITSWVNELGTSYYPNLTTIKNDSCKNIQKLVLSNLPSLVKLSWTKSELTILDLSHCPKLEVVDCSNNLLTEIILPLDAINLKKLYLSNNNFPRQDLSMFKNLLNLEELGIGNYRETSLRQISAGDYGESKIKQNIYNRFYGSLEPLKDLTNLNLLEINNTDIDSGLEYLRLDDSGKVIVYCLAQERPDCGVKEIWEKLETRGSDAQAWKRDNPSIILVALQKRLEEVKKELQIEKEKSKEVQDKGVKYQQQQEEQIKALEEKNTLLQKQLAELKAKMNQEKEQLQPQIEVNPKQN